MEFAAVKRGSAAEDGSPGYRLFKEPDARAAELAVREYALPHEDELIRVLQSSSSARDRETAVDALGYGARTSRQMMAPAQAARDPDATVRNNSTRAPGEILTADPSAARTVATDNFIAYGAIGDVDRP